MECLLESNDHLLSNSNLFFFCFFACLGLLASAETPRQERTKESFRALELLSNNRTFQSFLSAISVQTNVTSIFKPPV